MRALAAALAILAALAFPATGAGPAAPSPIDPEGATWIRPPSLPGVQGAWLLGSEDRAGMYLFRVRLAPGARIPPHTHPDERSTTVLKGAIHVGFGDAFDESKMFVVRAGSIYVARAGERHYILAKDGEAEYQESGVGPTATRVP